jgi:glycosyltransferase involved in cell wall biosynthesis
MDWYFRIIPEYATQRAAAVVTVSEAAKRSIMQYLGLAEMGVFVTYEAASCIYKRMDDVQEIGAMRQKFGLSYEFILAIGSADPRKNIGTLIQAYGLLPVALREQYKLVIVWTHHFLASELANLVRKLDLAADVQFLMHAHNEDLVLLYNAATLFVFPSRYEGFGLPILEAMACGAPVVASNNSSIPEVAGDAAVLVKGQEPEDWASIMTQMLESQALRLDLTNRGFRHAGTFSWTRCAQETLEVYETVVDES